MAFIFVSSYFEIPLPETFLNYTVAIVLGILAFIFLERKSEYLTITQHGLLHDNLFDDVERTHDHGHKETDTIHIYILIRKN